MMHFKTIINFVLPLNFKWLVCVFNHYSPSKAVNLLKNKAKNREKTYKFYQKSLANDNEVSQNSVLCFRKLKPKFCWKKALSITSSLSQCLANGKREELIRIDFEWKLNKCIQDLVKLRNILFKKLGELHENFYDCDIYQGFTKVPPYLPS